MFGERYIQFHKRPLARISRNYLETLKFLSRTEKASCKISFQNNKPNIISAHSIVESKTFVLHTLSQQSINWRAILLFSFFAVRGKEKPSGEFRKIWIWKCSESVGCHRNVDFSFCLHNASNATAKYARTSFASASLGQVPMHAHRAVYRDPPYGYHLNIYVRRFTRIRNSK